jgi:hypothetical protein
MVGAMTAIEVRRKEKEVVGYFRGNRQEVCRRERADTGLWGLLEGEDGEAIREERSKMY